MGSSVGTSLVASESLTRFLAFVVGWVAFGVLLAISIPDDILSRSAIARTFAEGMASMVPSIDKITALSRFPEVTRFFGAVFWALLPGGVLLAFLFPEPINWKLLREHALRTAISVPLIAMLLVGFLFFFPVAKAPSNLVNPLGHGDALLGLLSRSRLGLGLIGSITFLAQALALAACARIFMLLPVLFSNRTPSSRSSRQGDSHVRKR